MNLWNIIINFIIICVALMIKKDEYGSMSDEKEQELGNKILQLTKENEILRNTIRDL